VPSVPSVAMSGKQTTRAETGDSRRRPNRVAVATESGRRGRRWRCGTGGTPSAPKARNSAAREDQGARAVDTFILRWHQGHQRLQGREIDDGFTGCY